MTATTDKLSDLHAALADTMNDALDAEISRIAVTTALYEIDMEQMDEKTAKHLTSALSLAPAARVDNGLLKTIASFLKDNNITTDLSDGDEEDATTVALAAMKENRRKVQLPTDLM